jgi:gliding motility-associated-like protein
MFMKALRLRILLMIFIGAVNIELYAQASLCPSNIDFKKGNFDNWQCLGGTVAILGGVNTPTWNHFLPDPARHLLIPPTNREVDEYAGFPKHCPGSNSYSVRLGSQIAGHEADGLFYTFTIPATAARFSLLYNYAVVLQNPGHRAEEQPRFRARIIDVETNTEVNCVSFDFTASGSLTGFRPTSDGTAVYKDWTPISVDLSSYSGKTIRLEFITSDCTFQEHAGYAYIDVSSVCNGTITGNFYCAGDTRTTLTAPHGFQSYAWYSDASFTQLISNFQQLSLEISTTPVGSVLPLIVTPYPGYGCADTLYAVIGQAQKPLSDAGPDLASCSKQPTRLGTVNNPDYSYSWTPVQLVSDAAVSNPFSAFGLQGVTEFVVQATDLLSGCSSRDTVVVTPVLVDTSASVAGEMIYCPGETLNTTLSVDNNGTVAQWFQGNTPISSATGLSYDLSSVGTYWAEIRQFGCIDSSRQFTIHQAPLPKPDFSMNKEIQCLNEPILFSNKTSIPGNEPVRYTWHFGDGSLSQTINAEKSFRNNGIYTTTLIAISGTDCTDSIQKQVMIINDCMPIMPTAFTPNSDGKNDDLKPFLPGAKGLKRFTVFNRWGKIVFTTTKEGEGWSGTHNGMPLQTSVFVWLVEYVNKENKVVTQKGTVTLIR